MTYPEITLIGSKGGLHQVRNGPAVPTVQAAKMRGTRFPVVKSVDNLGVAIDTKAIDSTTITVARLTHAEMEAAPGMDDLPGDNTLEYMAETMIQHILTHSNTEERESVDLWEVWNEPRPHTVAGYVRLAQLMKYTILHAANHNLRVAIFSFNSGTPEWDEIMAMLGTGIMQLANERRAWVALHEGLVGLPPGVPVNIGLGTAIINPFTGATSPAFSDAGPWLFRYRFWLHAAKELRITLPPFLISEWGCIPQGYLADTLFEEVVSRYAWYDAEASRDPIQVAYLPFSIGQDWPGEQWEGYYLDPDRHDILDHMDAVRERRNTDRQPLVEPTPPAIPERVAVKDNAFHKWNLRVGPGTQFSQGSAVLPSTEYPVLDAVWGNTNGRVEPWYMVHPSGFPPVNTPPLWIASSAVVAI